MKKKLILFSLCLVLLPVVCFATSVTVCDTGCTHTTIAAALMGVGNGNHTITVKAPYSANENITINKSGSGIGSELTIQASGTQTVKGFTLTGTNGTGAYVIIKGFNVSQTSDAYGIYSSTSNVNYVTVDGNTFGGVSTRNSAIAILSLNIRNWTVKNNRLSGIHSSGQEGDIVNRSSYSIFEDNIQDGGAGDFFYMWGHHNVIRGNIQRNGINGGGYDLIQSYHVPSESYPSYNIVFEGNMQYDNVQSPSSEGFQTIGNLSYDSYTDIHDWTFRNNILWNQPIQGNFGVPNLRFYNNLFYYNNWWNTDHVVNIISGGGDWYCPNAYVKNNIFIGNGNNSSNGWYTIATDGGFQADYNYIARTPNFQAYTSFDTPFVAGGREAHGVNGGDPKFLNFANKDFHLTAASTVLIGKGENLSGAPDATVLIGANNESYTAWTRFDTDFDGKTRPAGAWAIGPYEYVQTGGDTTPPSPPTGVVVS